MELTFNDRLIFFQLYPERGNIITLRLIKDIRDKVDFAAEEMDKYKIKASADGRVTWDKNLDVEMGFAVDLTNSELEFLKDRIRELDNSKSIPFSLLSLCEKINKEPSEDSEDDG